MNKKILIIEDNNEVRENLAEILELAGYDVVTAADGKEGVRLTYVQSPDLIICDIMMPELDGYGVLYMLNKNPDTARIPFIFLTAKSEKADLRKGMETGADDYLTKPFNDIELLNTIEIRLKKAALRKENTASSTTPVASEEIEEAEALLEKEADARLFSKKQLIYQEGKQPYYLHRLIRGKVKLFRSNENGKELITELVSEGAFFGYAEIFENCCYADSAEAIEDAEVMVIPREKIKTLMTSNPSIVHRFIGLLTRTVAEKSERLLSIAYDSIRKRVADALLLLMKTYHDEEVPGSLQISRENLAQIVGTSTESVIRVLSDFREEGLISIDKGRIHILQEKKLRNLIG